MAGTLEANTGKGSSKMAVVCAYAGAAAITVGALMAPVAFALIALLALAVAVWGIRSLRQRIRVETHSTP